MDTIDDAYKYVAGQEKEWCVVHIGGKLYASVSSGYPCVHLRYFFRSDDYMFTPSKNGITLTLPMWENLKKFAVELRDNELDLKNPSLCIFDTDLIGCVNCNECNTLEDSFGPSITIKRPTFRSSK